VAHLIAEWLLQLGVAMFLVGAGCILASMLMGTQDQGRFSAWFRGSFQRPQDYTPRGWRLFQAGRAFAVVGILHIVAAFMIGGR
jgi:hypothetical protein